jgi:hypothetical protein
MPPQVMGTKVDTYQLSSFQYDHPCCLLGNRKYPIIGLFTYFVGIITESFGHFLWDEDEFLRFAAFRRFKDQLLILKVFQHELQHSSHPHPAPGHQFKS